MATELYIRNSDKRLMLHKDGVDRYLTGRQVATGQGASQIFIHASTNTLRWVDNAGVLRQAKGIDVGASGQSEGGLFFTSAGSVRFVRAGRFFNPYRNTFVNDRSLAGTTLYVYSNSARTTLLGSAAAGGSFTYEAHIATYYCRLRGGGGDVHDFTVTAYAGYTYTVTGSYSAGQEASYSCDCVFDSRYDSSSCSPRNSACQTSTSGDGSCRFGGSVCSRFCSYVSSGVGYYEVEESSCETRTISNGRPAVWNVTVTES